MSSTEEDINKVKDIVMESTHGSLEEMSLDSDISHANVRMQPRSGPHLTLARRNMGSQRCWNHFDISISKGDTLITRKIPCDITWPALGDYKGSAWMTEGVLIWDLDANVFGVLSAVQASKP
ncbi:hypothetical protein AVEN_114802-1 [Araneus ventricosus]|uniref:Uncharacterized protein n=1 Tax=Araneus ventricosus TaxID=182803 RepID=A0A4Y2ILM3_ARAVE|nr:hypothetical protein AVEN_114802-1 [Araneus ventricosus]